MRIITKVKDAYIFTVNHKAIPCWLLWMIYVLLTVTQLSAWNLKQAYSVTGDEPHYLVMADGIIKDGTFEQTAAYEREFKSRKIYKPGLAAREAVPSPQNAHAVLGPHGLYNLHNIGLPLLLSLAYYLGGIFGAKLLMVFLSSLIVPLAWRVASLVTIDPIHHILATAASVFGATFFIASNQIYPDLPAGIIALAACCLLLRGHTGATLAPIELLCIATLISFMPWLQIKFAAAGLILSSALSLQAYLQEKSFFKPFFIFLCFFLSLFLLIAYNTHAFGKATGPYQHGALQLSWHSLMVLIGLHIDRFQGVFLQNPFYLIGIVFIVAFIRTFRLSALIVLLVYCSFIVPNAMHPNWYGGGSFAGRFAWAAAVTFLPVVIFSITNFLRDTRFGLWIVALGMLINIIEIRNCAFGRIFLLNASPETTLDNYPGFYPAIQRFLPALYNVDWALEFPPNAAFAVFTIGLFILGFTYQNCSKKQFYERVCFFCAVSIAYLFAVGMATSSAQKTETIAHSALPTMIWHGADLPSQVGVVENRSLKTSMDSRQGFLSYGPYIPMAPGRYHFKVVLEAAGMDESIIGWVDVYILKGNKNLYKSLILSSTLPQVVAGTFDIDPVDKDALVEVRTFYNGHGRLKVDSITIEPFANN